MYSNDKKDKVTVINLALKDVAPIGGLDVLAQITIEMNHPRQDGLTTEVENGILNNVVMAIASKCKDTNNAVHIGHYTSGGKWIVFFYCYEAETFEDLVSDRMAGFADYTYSIDFQNDKQWNVYAKLYPTKRQFQSMGNLHVIEQLIEHGVDLNEARDVEHTVCFKNRTDRKSYLKKVQKKGFESIDTFHDGASKQYPFFLVISRVDKVDWKSVDEYVFELMDLAEKHDGFYDGWATYITVDEA